MEYNHFVSVAALVVNDKDEVLMIKSPDRGWEYPGGMVEPKETLQKALIREIKEETGVGTQIVAFVGICKNIDTDIVNIDFICKYVNGDLKTSNESLDVKWVSKQNALELVTYPITKKRLENMLSYERKVQCFGFHKNPFNIVDNEIFMVGL